MTSRQFKLNDSLYNASARGQAREVKRLLGLGADINFHDPAAGYQTPLHACCSPMNDGKTDVAAILLQHGADPNSKAKGRGDCTPLAMACLVGLLPLVKLLLTHKADPNITSTGPSGEGRVTCLILAVTTACAPQMISRSASVIEIITLLIDAGAEVTASSDKGGTALHVAASSGSIPLVRLLLSRGANGSDAIAIARVHCPPSTRSEILDLLKGSQIERCKIKIEDDDDDDDDGGLGAHCSSGDISRLHSVMGPSYAAWLEGIKVGNKAMKASFKGHHEKAEKLLEDSLK